MNQARRRNNQLEIAYTHHALVGNCFYCMRVGFVGMRCKCNTGGVERYIILLNGQQLRGNDKTMQEPPEPMKVCAFYHSIVPTRVQHYNTMTAFTEGGYTIEHGFTSGWDKVFAHPTQPWTLPKSKTDNFENTKDLRRYKQSWRKYSSKRNNGSFYAI